jgi:putative transcriptional regulator
MNKKDVIKLLRSADEDSAVWLSEEYHGISENDDGRLWRKVQEKLNGEIIFNIDVMLAKRKMSVTELADRVGITIANMSVLKNGKAKALKISTLLKLCEALDCQPGDILEYRKEI